MLHVLNDVEIGSVNRHYGFPDNKQFLRPSNGILFRKHPSMQTHCFLFALRYNRMIKEHVLNKYLKHQSLPSFICNVKICNNKSGFDHQFLKIIVLLIGTIVASSKPIHGVVFICLTNKISFH